MEQLDHPHCLTLHRWHRHTGQLTLVLELCTGPELQAVLDVRGSLGEDASRLIVRQVADALAYLHQRTIVHRDLKPANLMLTTALGNGSAEALRTAPLTSSTCVVKLLDFGLSKQLVDVRTMKYAPHGACPGDWVGMGARPCPWALPSAWAALLALS